MKILYRPEATIVQQIFAALAKAPSQEDGRYLMVNLIDPEAGGRTTTIEFQECKPGDLEPLENVKRTSTVMFKTADADKHEGLALAYFYGQYHNGACPFHYHTNCELTQDLGGEIVAWVLRNHRL